MRTTTLEWLACPVPECHGELAVSDAVPPSFGPGSRELAEGVLECGACRAAYPVLLGVALLEADLGSWLNAFWDEVEAWDGAAGAGIGRRMRAWIGAPGAHSGLAGPPQAAGDGRQWSTSPYLQAHFDPVALTANLPPGWWRDSVQRRSAGPDPYSWLLAAAGRLAGAGSRGLAFDVGTSVGRGAAELAGLYRQAIGVDRSFSAVLTSRRLHLGEPEPLESYSAEIERGRWAPRPLAPRAPATGLDFVVASGDALPAGDRAASCVAALNVLCAVPNPAAMVFEFGRILAPGGLLLAASPYWSEPGGPESRAWDGPDAMRRALAADFEVREEEDMVPWLLQLTRRRWNVYLSHCVAATRRQNR